MKDGVQFRVLSEAKVVVLTGPNAGKEVTMGEGTIVTTFPPKLTSRATAHGFAAMVGLGWLASWWANVSGNCGTPT